jgi:hypothetical protein
MYPGTVHKYLRLLRELNLIYYYQEVQEHGHFGSTILTLCEWGSTGLDRTVVFPGTVKPVDGKTSLFKNAKASKFKNPKGTTTAVDVPVTESFFDRFWALYPKKVDKGKALTQWRYLCNKPAEKRPAWGIVKLAVLQQIKTERWQDSTFIPNPATWIHQSRWLDDPNEMVVFKRKDTTAQQSFGSRQPVAKTSKYKQGTPQRGLHPDQEPADA